MSILRFLFYLVITSSFFYIGCSDVKFKSVPLCDGLESRGGNVDCTPPAVEGGVSRIQDIQRAGRVDILFVVDNSGSMYEEQTEMANKFPNFLSSIANLDYQIGIITTDISLSPNNAAPRAANGNGAFQDGKFLIYPDGSHIISNSTPNALSYFQSTIKRDETFLCDTSSTATCPSGDERAIYALNLAVERGYVASFFVPESHLAVVILSDEDERSKGGALDNRPLEDKDLPINFVKTVNGKFGFSKTLSAHAVVIKPGDSQCFSQQQNANGWNGTYANIYKQLTQPNSTLQAEGQIVSGALGSICSQNYGAQLGDIASTITQNVNNFALVCSPVDDVVDITFDPEISETIEYSIDEGNRLILDPPVRAGVDVKIGYNCNSL